MSEKPKDATFQADCDLRGRIAFDWPQQVIAFCQREFSCKRVDVTFRLRKAKRTDRQNRALHRLLQDWSREKGHDIEQLKDDLLALAFGVVVRQNLLTGEVVKSLVEPHTSRLSVEQFSTLFELMIVEAAKDGVVLELPDEWKARQKKGRAA